MTAKIVSFTLLQKCPNTEVFLVRIFPHSDYLSIFSPNAGIYGPGKTPYLGTFHKVFLMLSSKQKNYIIPSISLFLHIVVLVDLLSINRLTWLVSLGIQSECGKIRTRKNSVFGHFSQSVSHVE